jgi:hypothetical protein
MLAVTALSKCVLFISLQNLGIGNGDAGPSQAPNSPLLLPLPSRCPLFDCEDKISSTPSRELIELFRTKDIGSKSIWKYSVCAQIKADNENPMKLKVATDLALTNGWPLEPPFKRIPSRIIGFVKDLDALFLEPTRIFNTAVWGGLAEALQKAWELRFSDDVGMVHFMTASEQFQVSMLPVGRAG